MTSGDTFGPSPASRRAKPSLRPVDDLAAELDNPPIAATPKGKRAPAPDDLPPGDIPTDDAPPPRGTKPDRPFGEIWRECPVKALGVNGAFSYYLDALGQLRALGKHERQAIMSLFAHRMPVLCHHFAQWMKDEDGNQTRKPNAFNADHAAMAMYAACGERGLFDADGAVRGVGAWADDDGQLIYHLGDALMTADGTEQPMTHQGRIYPAYPAIPHPGKPDAGVAATILDTLATWKWDRDIDPMITLGMIGVQMLGGALDWRPTFWVTGGKASGKSTLQDLVEHLHGGRKGIIKSIDTTKSGLTSQIGHSSLPVAVDELEPGDERSTKEKQIIELARTASSGGQWLRGSSDQKGASGNVYSTFLFSSILMPGELTPQDRSRLIVLRLQPFADNAKAPDLRAATWRKRGAALKGNLVARWDTWRQRLDLWLEAFAGEGLSGRNGKNWATVLAMADMALHEDQPDADVLSGWARRVAVAARVEVADIGSDADSMLMHLLTQSLNVYNRGEQNTVAQWVMVAGQLPGAPKGLLSSTETLDERKPVAEAYAEAANRKLAKYGLRVYGEGATATLFIANASIQGLLDLFKGSAFAKGVWQQSAARVPGATPAKSPARLEGVSTRGWHIPFTSMPGLLSFPMDRAAAPAPVGPPEYTSEDFA